MGNPAGGRWRMMGMLLASLFLPCVANAAPMLGSLGELQSMAKPYREVRLPQNLDLSHRVIEVFEFGCPYCRQMNAALLHWGRSLPKSYSFTQMPALVTDQYFPMTLATFAVYEIDPSRIPAFEDKAFSLVQTWKKPLSDPAVYLAAANAAGIPPKTFIQAVNSQSVKALTVEDGEIMKITGVTKTPSLIICGKYVIDPSDTRGNASMFIQLANGLVSRCMMEEGAH